MFPYPEQPQLPPDQQSVASMTLRYSDVTQDGRMSVLAIPHGNSPALWDALLRDHPVSRALAAQGVLPIMSRLLVESGEGPLSASAVVDLRVAYQLAHTLGEDGDVERLVMLSWLTLHAPRGATHPPQPPGAGEPIQVGRCFAEHVFTRPFAPPAERKVLSFDVADMEPVPAARYTWQPPETLLHLPADAVPLDAELRADPTDIVFGLDHTDSNHHVNSLVYPQIFIDAALRRLGALVQSVPRRCHHLEVAYRKPSFAGERLRIHLRAFSFGGTFGASLVLAPHADIERPRVTARLLLAP
ncbi:Hypothetical protein CAP_7357 [Chondromyces apiculatus DSM 436]|uniref:Uncharacterized protein n=2 Tax=Chondromyces apiculatus TaxID=51 RepID=A0A017SZ00_9BACT|nr:hypothetical protein [Chondromyces apiculatus]EYF02214.1 Hypothetical protein CAP_7357 [Chondromyces apiculatus DSM 436]